MFTLKRSGFLPSIFLSVSLLSGCGTTQSPPITGAQGPAGPAGLIFLNAYNPATTYVRTDVATYQGSSYVAISTVTNVAPIGAATSSTTWAVLAQAGAVGAAGPAGTAGVQGPQGIPGLRGSDGAQGPMGVQGPTGATGPAGPQGVAGTNMVSFLQNLNFSVQGDSIAAIFGYAWQHVVADRTGMQFFSQDARPGRAFPTAFECYGNPSPGGTLGPYSSDNKEICGGSTFGMTDGFTLAQNMAKVDVLLISLGTNDTGAFTLGNLGDATNSGTFYGNMRWVVENYLAAKPSMRMILVAPETSFSTFAILGQYADAMVAYGKSVGVPVIDLRALGGVNQFTLSTLTADGIHPSPIGFSKFYGPVIAQGVQSVF